MKALEGFFQLLTVVIALVFSYFSTMKLFNVNMSLPDLIFGLFTYFAYLFVAASSSDGIHKWFKKVHWDKLEELKKVETK